MLSSILREGGVKKVEIGGAYLNLDNDPEEIVWISEQSVVRLSDALGRLRSLPGSDRYPWLSDGYLPSGCVGSAGIELLMQGFEVEFSSAVARGPNTTIDDNIWNNYFTL